jgi:hypothetical protein
MKKLQLIIVVLFLAAISAFAQDRGGNQKYDPAFNPYEKILEDTARGKRTAKFLKNLYMPDCAKDKFYSSPCNEYATLAETRVTQFNEFVNKFLSMPADPKQMKLAEVQYNKDGVRQTVEIINYEATYIEQQGTYSSNAKEPIENLVCRVKGSLQLIKNSLAYMEAVRKLFPSAAGVNEGIASAKEMLAKYPDNKAIIALVKGNKNTALADVFMPKAVAQNAEWEGWFKNYFTKAFPGYTIVRNHLQSANWYIKKNEISGLPEYRQIGTKIGAKAPDGKCYIITIDIYQDYLGGKFTESRFTKGDKQEILCENLK